MVDQINFLLTTDEIAEDLLVIMHCSPPRSPDSPNTESPERSTLYNNDVDDVSPLPKIPQLQHSQARRKLHFEIFENKRRPIRSGRAKSKDAEKAYFEKPCGVASRKRVPPYLKTNRDSSEGRNSAGSEAAENGPRSTSLPKPSKLPKKVCNGQ